MARIWKIRIFRITFLMIFAAIGGNLFAQAPRISSFEPRKASAGSLVTITGDGFPTDKTRVVVRFGAARGEVVSSAANTIEVKVPPGATFGSISVTNLSNNLIGYSIGQFMLTYGGSTFDPANLATPVNFPTVYEIFDICLCDFDGDGKVDVGSATLDAFQSFIFKNTTTKTSADPTASPNPTFSTQFFNIPGKTRAIVCADLNGDAKPEMLLTRGDEVPNSFFVLQNESIVGTIKFSTNVQNYSTANETQINRLAVRDLDGDGTPEVIATNFLENDKRIFIFKNESTASLVKLNAIPQVVNIVGGTDSFDVEAVDLNDDSKPDLVIIPSLKQYVYVMLNTTTARNSFTFADAIAIQAPGNFREMVLTEINGDNLPDLAISNSSQSKIHLLTNTSAGNTISFSWKDITSSQPFSVDGGDLNGDGLGDVIGTNIGGSDMKILLNNTSLPSTSPSFQEFLISGDAVADQSILFTRQIKIGDVNIDGKPDLVFTTWDRTFSKFNLSIIRNKNCIEPEIRPAGPLSVCSGQTITFQTPPALNVTYQWKADGVNIVGATSSTFDYVVDGTSPMITVEVISEAGTCVKTSNQVSVIYDPGNAPSTPVLTDPAPVCLGSDVMLTGPAPDVIGTTTTYFWRGPDGFTSNVQNPTIVNATPEKAGYYFYSIKVDNCTSDEGSLFLEVVSPPTAGISTVGSSVICAGQSSITLEVNAVADFSYQWKLNGNAIAGATGVTHNASQPGDYTVTLSSNIASCTTTTPVFTVSSISPPVADFNAVTTGCVNQVIQFENISQASQAAVYLWDFGDGSMSSEADPTHNYSAANTYSVSLTVNYGDATCQDIVTKSIVIATSPIIVISSPATEICTGDTLALTATGTYTSLEWSTLETTDIIEITKGGKYYVTALNAEGCKAADTVDIVELAPPVVEISADPGTSINQGESVILTATGGLSYSWTPTETLDNPGVASPIATPDTTTVYQVEVTGENGCVTIADIEILVGFELDPAKIFSPNEDGIDDDWIIRGITSMPNCTVVIFDRQGRKVYESQPYLNDWRATTSDGSALPAGPYYFIIKCDNEVAKTGSVLVVR